MPTVTYHCLQCERTANVAFADGADTVECPHCGTPTVHDHACFRHGRLEQCLLCPSRDLFLRKDFSPRVGVTIVVLGFAASTVAWANYQIAASFAILFATAVIDLVLFLIMGNVVECYCCHAQYRGLSDETSHGRFDLEVHEKHRQHAARLQEHQRAAASTDSA